jgi:hypothetical protein
MTEIVYGMCHPAEATFTRPSDTTAYAAGDVVCNSTSAPTIMEFSPVLKLHSSGSVLAQAILVTSANVATKPDLELWLFDTTITMDNDNAAFTPTDAEMKTLVGIIEFPTADFKVGTATSGADGNAVCQASNLGIVVNTVTGTKTSLFGVLVVRNAYVPVSGEVFTVRLKFLD